MSVKSSSVDTVQNDECIDFCYRVLSALTWPGPWEAEEKSKTLKQSKKFKKAHLNTWILQEVRVPEQRRWRFSSQLLLKSDTQCLLRVDGTVSEWSELALKVWIWSVAVLVQITESPGVPEPSFTREPNNPTFCSKTTGCDAHVITAVCVFVVSCSVSVRSGTKLASSTPLRPNSWNECQENTGYYSERVAFPPEWNMKLGGLRTCSVMLDTCVTASSDSLWIATCRWCHICGALTDCDTTVSKIRNTLRFFSPFEYAQNLESGVRNPVI